MLLRFLSTDGHRLRRFFWGQDRPQVAGRESTSLIATTQWLAIVRVKALLGPSREGAKARSLVCGGLRSVGRDECHLSGPRYARQKSYTVQRFMFTLERGTDPDSDTDSDTDSHAPQLHCPDVRSLLICKRV